MTIRGIAKLIGVSVDTIRRRLNKYSITRSKITKEKSISKQTKHRVEVLTNYLKREPTREEINRPYWDTFKKEDVEKVYISCNYNIQKSSKVFDINEDTFRKILKHLSIPIHHNPKLSDYSDEFYKECIKSGMSYSDISEKTNLSSSTIGTYISKNFPELRLSREYSSFGENMVGVVLKSFGIQFRYNKQIYIEKDREVYIDFSFEFNNQEYWIEYNGKQHYEFIKYFHQIEDNFKRQQERDQEVRNYAAENDIILIEFPYNKFTTIDSISSYLLDMIPGTIINEPVDIFHLDPEILNNFKKSNKFKSNLFYIFDSNDGEILTTSEAAQKYKTIRTNVKSWSLKGKRGLKVLYKPAFNYKNKSKKK
jgi:transposase